MSRIKKVKTLSTKNKDLIRVSFHISLEQYNLIATIADEEDLCFSQVVRRALEMYLVTQKDILGIGDSDLAQAKFIGETRTKRALLMSNALTIMQAAKEHNLESEFQVSDKQKAHKDKLLMDIFPLDGPEYLYKTLNNKEDEMNP
jgi:UTP-glucose-1-phosphate uridylyltransferase